MKSTASNTVLLVFARSAEAEVSHKNFVPARSIRQNRKVAETLLVHTLRLSRRSGLPILHFDEQLQQGETFAERFYNAFCAAFDLGYERVIALGSDCVGLKDAHLSAAIDQLEESPVLGPARDGGLYLLGLSRSDFERLNFSNWSWQTGGLLESAMAEMNAEGVQAQMLETLSDIDRAVDLERELRSGKLAANLKSQLCRLLQETVTRKQHFHTPILQNHPAGTFSRRGPPLS